MNLLCLGDSLTYGYDVRPSEGWTAIVAAAGSFTVDNEGQCGDTTRGMLARLRYLDLDQYDAFFVMGGSNDVLLGYNLEDICQQMQKLIAAFKGKGRPIYVGIPPLTKPESAFYGWQAADAVEDNNEKLRQYRIWLLAYAAKTGCIPVDFYQALQTAEEKTGEKLYADGVHPNARGYAVLAQTALAAFTKS